MNILLTLQITTIVVGIITILLIILNQPHTDSTFGGSNSFQITRRGADLKLHKLTIVFSVIFILLVLLSKVV